MIGGLHFRLLLYKKKSLFINYATFVFLWYLMYFSFQNWPKEIVLKCCCQERNVKRPERAFNQRNRKKNIVRRNHLVDNYRTLKLIKSYHKDGKSGMRSGKSKRVKLGTVANGLYL